MISRELYCELMTDYITYAKKITALNDVLRPLDSTCGVTFEVEDLFVRTIEAALDDKDNWTSYFVYEQHGDLSKECVFEDDGETVIDTSDWGKVYDLILGGNNG